MLIRNNKAITSNCFFLKTNKFQSKIDLLTFMYILIIKNTII